MWRLLLLARYDGAASTGEGADRASTDLAGVQLDLLDAVIGTGVPTVVVLVHGRPVSFGEDHGGAVTSKFGSVPLYMRAAAVVAAWRPAQRSRHGASREQTERTKGEGGLLESALPNARHGERFWPLPDSAANRHPTASPAQTGSRRGQRAVVIAHGRGLILRATGASVAAQRRCRAPRRHLAVVR